MKLLLLYPASAEHLRRLQRAAPQAQLVVARDEEHARAEVCEADGILGNRYCMQILPAARRVRWVQSNSVGMDLLLQSPCLQKESITLCNARGVYDDELADHAVALLLGLVRRLNVGRWQREPAPPLRGQRALFLGAGGIARATAARLNAFGMECLACARQRRSDAYPFHTVVGTEEWRPLLSSVQALFVTLPLTVATRNLVDAEVLRSLPAGALLINVARGELVDEQALQSELHRLGGAGLDVFQTEPLPEEHWLWRHPKVLATPHMGRSPERGSFRFESLFEENVRRFAGGEPLLNVVDKEAGY